MAILDKQRTDHMNKAATTVQRFTRGFLARKNYVRIQQAALYLQCAARARAARNVAQGLRRQKAALTIQVGYGVCDTHAHTHRHWRAVAVSCPACQQWW